ncbi:transcriptional regulator BolA [Enterobacteriaceae bacterium LUAb1]
MMQKQIEMKLRTVFEALHLEVHDESYRHNVPAGAESHFNVILVSDKFEAVRLLQRHRMVYCALKEELAGRVHALALHTYTLTEWKSVQNAVPASPDCHGAGT